MRILFLLMISFYVVNSVVIPSGFKLELVQSLFRHGDRTPSKPKSYPNDPYDSSNYDIYGYGQLTNDGRKRMYDLGKMFRERYGSFFSKTFKPEDIYAYSTNKDRTKLSLQLVLAGLFPPSSKEIWNPKLKWLPYPTYYNHAKFDFLSTTYLCPEVLQAYRRVVLSNDVQKVLNKYKSLFEFISQHTGLPLDPSNGFNLYNVIRAQTNLGLPFPTWCSHKVFEQLKEIAAFTFQTYVYTNELKSLISGPVLKRLITNINNNEERVDKRKMYLYSAHDTNVNTFLGSLDLQHTFPIADYGSAVIIEKLKGRDNKPYIRLLLYSSTEKSLTPLLLKNCDEICPLSTFVQIVEVIKPDDAKCLYRNAQYSVEDLINGSIRSGTFNELKLKYA